MEGTEAKIIKAKMSVFFAGCTLKRSGVILCHFKTRQSNFSVLAELLTLQKSEVDLFVRIGANSPQKLGRFIFDKCIIKNGEGQLSFSSLRDAVELQQVFNLPLPLEDMLEFDLLCKIYKAE